MKKDKITKIKSRKEPSLLRQVIEVYYERALQKKAIRILSKQKWSLEFLEYLVKHAANTSSSGIEIEITDIEGRKIKVSAMKNTDGSVDKSDILSRLDDPVAVQRFIMSNTRR